MSAPTPRLKTPLGRLLRSARTRAGLSYAELGLRLGVSTGYLSDLEHGRRLVAPARVQALSEALQLDPAWLLERVLRERERHARTLFLRQLRARVRLRSSQNPHSVAAEAPLRDGP